jgi:hypothetical protein
MAQPQTASKLSQRRRLGSAPRQGDVFKIMSIIRHAALLTLKGKIEAFDK